MSEVIVLHCGELILKGANRRFFERQLRANIRDAMKAYEVRITHSYGRVVIEPRAQWTDEEREQIFTTAKGIYGIATVLHGTYVKPTMEAIWATVQQYIADEQFETFGVRAKRSDKDFALTSSEIEREIGARVVAERGAAVDLKKPDLWIRVRLYNKQAHISVREERGPGGLPYATSGHLLSMLSAGIDSPVASHRMMQRGARLSYVHFHSYPLTSKESIDNAKSLVEQLHRAQPAATLYCIGIAPLQQAIVASAPPRLRTVLYRRAMFQLSERLAVQIKAKGLLTGESLGQVASQTIENMQAATAYTRLPILRPLIGMNKEEIVSTAREIGTYELSILPYDDCCSLLHPDQVETRATAEDLDEAIEVMGAQWDNLLDEAYNAIEKVEVA